MLEPIDRDRFEGLTGDALNTRTGTNASAVVSFPAENPDQTFTRAEVRDGADITDGSVGPVLSRLAVSGLVEHRGRYWALGPDDRDWKRPFSSFATKRGPCPRTTSTTTRSTPRSVGPPGTGCGRCSGTS